MFINEMHQSVNYKCILCLQVTDETTAILKHFGYVFEQRGLVSVKGKGQLMTYYLIGKGTNPEATLSSEEETKNNPDSNLRLNEDFKINLETNEDFSNSPQNNTNTTESIPVQHNPGVNLNLMEDSEQQNPGHNLDLSDDSKHQLLSEDTSPLILSSTAVISGSSETHLLEKSDAEDWKAEFP
jgi:hypothetical protein